MEHGSNFNGAPQMTEWDNLAQPIANEYGADYKDDEGEIAVRNAVRGAISIHGITDEAVDGIQGLAAEVFYDDLPLSRNVVYNDELLGGRIKEILGDDSEEGRITAEHQMGNKVFVASIFERIKQIEQEVSVDQAIEIGYGIHEKLFGFSEDLLSWSGDLFDMFELYEIRRESEAVGRVFGGALRASIEYDGSFADNSIKRLFTKPPTEIARFIDHFRQACLAEHRMIAVSVVWRKPQPYGKVDEVLDQAQAMVKAAGWQIASGVEGIVDTGTSVNDLREVWDFPENPSVGGYNAACGFTFEAEMPEKGFSFGEDEVAALEALAKQVLELL